MNPHVEVISRITGVEPFRINESNIQKITLFQLVDIIDELNDKHNMQLKDSEFDAIEMTIGGLFLKIKDE
jgi:hypothetical protein